MSWWRCLPCSLCDHKVARCTLSKSSELGQRFPMFSLQTIPLPFINLHWWKAKKEVHTSKFSGEKHWKVHSFSLFLLVGVTNQTGRSEILLSECSWHAPAELWEPFVQASVKLWYMTAETPNMAASSQNAGRIRHPPQLRVTLMKSWLRWWDHGGGKVFCYSTFIFVASTRLKTFHFNNTLLEFSSIKNNVDICWTESDWWKVWYL